MGVVIEWPDETTLNSWCSTCFIGMASISGNYRDQSAIVIWSGCAAM